MLNLDSTNNMTDVKQHQKAVKTVTIAISPEVAKDFSSFIENNQSSSLVGVNAPLAGIFIRLIY